MFVWWCVDGDCVDGVVVLCGEVWCELCVVDGCCCEVVCWFWLCGVEDVCEADDGDDGFVGGDE